MRQGEYQGFVGRIVNEDEIDAIYEVKPEQVISKLAEEAMSFRTLAICSDCPSVSHWQFKNLTDALRDVGKYTGTSQINTHPITQAWVDKLASLAGVSGNVPQSLRGTR